MEKIVVEMSFFGFCQPALGVFGGVMVGLAVGWGGRGGGE